MGQIEQLKQIVTNHSRMAMILIVITLASSCSAPVRTMRIVDDGIYRNDERCWKNEDGNFEAFLIIARSKQGSIPYFVSGKCMVGHSSRHEIHLSTLENINSIRVIYASRLAAGLNEGKIIDNVSTDLQLPMDNDPVYAFSANLTLEKSSPVRIYGIRKVKLIRQLEVNFLSLAETTPDERSRLFQSNLERAN